MNAFYKDSKEMLVRILKVMADHPTITSAAAVAALVPKIATDVAEINALGGGQVAGFGQYRSGSAVRRSIADELLQSLADIAQMGRIFDKGAMPGLAAKLRLGKSVRTYQALQDAGTAFLEVLTPTPVKTLLIDHGYTPTFLTDLAGLVAALGTATDEKYGGLGRRVNSTAMLTATTRKVVLLARELDGILTPQLRKSDPGLYAGWKRAVHIRSRKAAEEPVKSDQGEWLVGEPPLR